PSVDVSSRTASAIAQSVRSSDSGAARSTGSMLDFGVRTSSTSPPWTYPRPHRLIGGCAISVARAGASAAASPRGWLAQQAKSFIGSWTPQSVRIHRLLTATTPAQLYLV